VVGTLAKAAENSIDNGAAGIQQRRERHVQHPLKSRLGHRAARHLRLIRADGYGKASAFSLLMP